MTKINLKVFIIVLIALFIGYLRGARSQGGLPVIPEEGDGAQELNLMTHIQAEFPEQDVFIETFEGSDFVRRIEANDLTSEDILSQNLFATAEETEHDPFKTGSNPVGPFEKGKSLGLFLGDWLSAEGVGSYNVQGNEAIIVINFKNLVPNGVYTVWCSRMKAPPNPLIIDLPCGAIDGSENSFKTDSNGNSEFMLSMMPLEETKGDTSNVIAVAYHSDGRTYGASPGSFGQNTHVQLFYLLPAMEDN